MDQVRNVKTNSLNIGMNKDVDPLFLKDGQYLNAINAKLNSHNGDYSLIQNEPSTIKCLQTPYDFIGSIKLPDGKYAVFSTNDFFSEIGVFDTSDCSYKKLVNSTCLGFKRTNLISGRSKENFDCSVSIYWTDGINPRRFLNITDLPYKYNIARDACKTKEYTNEIDCQAMLLQSVLDYPQVSLELGTDGNIKNGAYQASVAYSINGEKISDFMSTTAPVHVFSHDNRGRSLEVSIQNLDPDFEEYILAIVYTIDGVTAVDIVGTYDTAQSKVIVTAVGQLAPNNKAYTLDELLQSNIFYEKADDVVSTSEYLLWTNPTSRTELNYQKYANEIKTKFVGYKVPADYYKKGGNKVGMMRDEIIAYGIQWLYNTGDWSPVYPIPGREAESDDKSPINTSDVYEFRDPDYDGAKRPQKYQVYNTAYLTPIEGTNNDKNIIYEGRMGYHESSERYADNEELYGPELKCTPIRHHRMPDTALVPLHTSPVSGDVELILLGARFENIQWPLNDEGQAREDIVGYRIVRGDRSGNKSVIGKGLLFNTGSYTEDDGEEVLYPNYPYNDLRADPFLSVTKTSTSGSAERNFRAFSNFKNDKFTFHSPSFSFNNPGIGSELKIECERIANVKGKFEEVYKHPKHKLITNFAAGIAVFIGTAEGYLNIRGRTCTSTKYSLKITFPPAFEPEATTTKCDTAITKAGFGGILGSILSLTTSIIGGAIAFGYYFTQGVDASLKIIKAFGAYQQYAYQYNSHGFYNEFDLPKLGSMRRRISYGEYLLPGYQYANQTKINNFQRESSVYLELDAAIDNPTNQDTSRRTIGEFGQCGKDQKFTSSQATSYYAAIRRNIPNLYGQLESINYLDTASGIFRKPTVGDIVSTGIVFGGDTYLSRMTVKRKMSYFNQTLFDVQPGAEWNYLNYYNIPYPRFWINTEEYDSEEVLKIQLASSKHNFDCRNSDNSLFIIKNRTFYLFNSGIIDFYCESEYNLENRDWDESINGKHYDRYTYSNVSDLLRSDRIPYDNKYLFDRTYLKPLLENFIPKQRRDFDPKIASSCYTTFKNRVIYSQPATKEQIRDNWRVYLPNNYINFNKEEGNLTTVKPFGRDRLVFLFDRSGPSVSLGVDTLQTTGGIDVVLGDGGLFARRPQKIVYSDYAYGSSQSRWAYVNTQFGGFYPSQKQGKVFMFTGDGLDEISRGGLNWWFKENLPSKLVEQFPNYTNTDNPISGVALVSIYDNTDDIYYLSKVDYAVKAEWLSRARYDSEQGKFLIGSTPVQLGDPAFFDDASWTVSYDIKTKSWISFHDWHPQWTFQTENHFLTYKNKALWKHNESCNSFCNFYGEDKPFEIEFAVSNGQQVSTLASLEWNLEAYKYYNNCYDTFHLLDYNFDEMMVYTPEQNSGLIKLFPRPKQIVNNYPFIFANRIESSYEKVEQKYRVNQFWDSTKDRGEFSGKMVNMFNTQPNGYRKTLNKQYFNYLKDQFQRKKFRNSYYKIMLRRTVNNDVKMIFKYNNSKQTASFR